MSTTPTLSLTEYLDRTVTVDIAGRTTTGTVRDVDHGLGCIHPDPTLHIDCGSGATLRVSPDALREP